MKRLYCLIFGHRIDRKYYAPILAGVQNLDWPVFCEDCKAMKPIGKMRIREFAQEASETTGRD